MSPLSTSIMFRKNVIPSLVFYGLKTLWKARDNFSFNAMPSKYSQVLLLCPCLVFLEKYSLCLKLVEVKEKGDKKGEKG